MKYTAFHLSLFTVGLALLLPTGRTQSQLAPAVNPEAEFQALQTANDDLIKRQETTLKELTDMTATANEIRIFSKRG